MAIWEIVCFAPHFLDAPAAAAGWPRFPIWRFTNSIISTFGWNHLKARGRFYTRRENIFWHLPWHSGENDKTFSFFFFSFKDIFSPDFWRKTWVNFWADFWATLCVVLASLAGVSASFPSDRLAMIFQGYQKHTPCCFSFDKRSVYSTAVDLWPRGEMDKDFLLAKWWISQYNLDISNFTPKTFKIHLH